MKKKRVFAVFVVAASMFLAACGGLGKMEKYIKDLNAKATPNPLELHGDSVQVTITGQFPAKYFHKKVVAEATPVLKYDGGETAYKMRGFQGEQAAGNYEKVPFKTGKNFSYTDKIGYKPEMANSTLEVRLHGTQGKKTADFPPIQVGEGVITTPLLLKNDDKPMYSMDKFVRTKSFNTEAEINFDYNSSVVKPAQLKREDLVALAKFADSCQRNTRLVIKKIDMIGYASPEGELFLNDNLANERTTAGKKVFMDLMKKNKLTNVTESMVQLMPKGEDWEGFRMMMEKSNIADRDIIIRILQKTTDLQQREQEIKNISKTYVEIQKDIFPALRRCRMVISYDQEGYSDAELKQIASTDPSVLNYEELLKAGSLVEDLNVKANVYKAATAKTDADYRAFNNLGTVYYLQAKMSDAKTNWKKAFDMQKSPETCNNMGIVSRQEGDRKGADKLFSEAGSKEAKYNKGLIAIQNGDYASAVSNMSDYATFNSALAKLLNKDNGGANTDIEKSGDTSGIADYLRAIICARNGDGTGVATNLKSAGSKDNMLITKAKKDLEFRNFKSAVN
jgi:outer membrane protein OmpA-like peptidoglycan-associated protein